ncbi:MAG TPA: hypothetical protein VMT85_11280 [Thermoanaerobaculia bacterium]|nr:hypothetical protein [Thermoanaerobaculia bacterium]
MDEATFERRHRARLDGLRRERGECPSVEELAALEADAAEIALRDHQPLTDERRRRVEAHLALCARCCRERELLAGLGTSDANLDEEDWAAARERLRARPAPWRDREVRPGRDSLRPWMAIAAAVLALVAGWWWWSWNSSGAPVSEVRGGILLTEPTGRVPAVDRFSWSVAAPAPLLYQVEVQIEVGGAGAGGAETGLGEPHRLTTTQTTIEPPPSLRSRLREGSRFRWRVVAFTGGADEPDRVFGRSSWVEVEVAEE